MNRMNSKSTKMFFGSVYRSNWFL